MADTLADYLAAWLQRSQGLPPGVFASTNERDAQGQPVVRADEVGPTVAQAASPWTKAQTIGAPGIGERYAPASVGELLASDNPARLLAESVVGGGRPRSVAAQDPYGAEAFLQGKGHAPLFLGSTAEVGPLGIRAYHGSPHDFERFDLSKIGTGEGAQAYGHGLYFAESEGVARSYRDQLGSVTTTPSYPALKQAMNEAADAGIAAMQSPSPVARAAARAADDRVRLLQEAVVAEPKGRMYEVNIKADPEHFLDWDTPLHQQSEHVQAALKNVGIEAPSDAERQMAQGRLKLAWEKWEAALKSGDTATAARTERAIKLLEDENRALNNPMTGQEVYQHLVENAPTSYQDKAPAVASQSMKDAGIPGIKYLDAASRNAGGWHITPPEQTTSGKWMVKSSDYNSKGMHFETEAEARRALAEKIASQTSNYVAFDDKTIDILRKYGLLPFLGAGAYGALAPRQPAAPE